MAPPLMPRRISMSPFCSSTLRASLRVGMLTENISAISLWGGSLSPGSRVALQNGGLDLVHHILVHAAMGTFFKHLASYLLSGRIIHGF